MSFNRYSFSVPIILRANHGKSNKIYIEAGPAFEIIPFKYGKGIEVLNSPTGSIENEISGDFQHDLVDFGGNVGTGLIITINDLKLIIGATYHNSLKNILHKLNDEYVEYIALKFGVIIN